MKEYFCKAEPHLILLLKIEVRTFPENNAETGDFFNFIFLMLFIAHETMIKK